jgi:hypothetical protein
MLRSSSGTDTHEGTKVDDDVDEDEDVDGSGVGAPFLSLVLA